MQTIPLISNNSQHIDSICRIFNQFIDEDIFLTNISTQKQALDYLTSEMPELVLIDFDDPSINGSELLVNIAQDAWLLNGGIISLCKSEKEAEIIENIKGTNLIVSLTHDELPFYLPRIMSIILNNRRILFQRGIGTDIVRNLSGSFKIENDYCVAKCYVNLICNFLFNTNRLSLSRKYHLKLALTEMLTNAIEHGNCGISSEEKSAWLQNGKEMGDLLRTKNLDPAICNKRVTFEYSLEASKGNFFIADEGNGFDWRHIKDATESDNLLSLNGRGILMTKMVVRDLIYNNKGNEVSFEIDFENGNPDLMPGLFERLQSRDIHPGDIIFREGELSNYLYYIVKGQFSVIVQGRTVSTLTPDDILMGEMSFLLNNRRSATVKAEIQGKLIEISKKDFIEALKSKPHYSLFLCRLLAQRIQRTNQAR